ncbi:MAG: hypothetical protein O2960_29090 [Verrucomicrobia bacterium]|nr:hypothetical protein [Verrucomicrobiota bacterium]
MNKPNFYIPHEVYAALVQRGDWKMHELPLASGELVRNFFGNQKTFALFSSGLSPDAIAKSGELVAGIDWVRIEANPKKDEPPLNINRYMVGSIEGDKYPVFHCGHSGTPNSGWANLKDLDSYLNS